MSSERPNLGVDSTWFCWLEGVRGKLGYVLSIVGMAGRGGVSSFFQGGRWAGPCLNFKPLTSCNALYYSTSSDFPLALHEDEIKNALTRCDTFIVPGYSP